MPVQMPITPGMIQRELVRLLYINCPYERSISEWNYNVACIAMEVGTIKIKIFDKTLLYKFDPSDLEGSLDDLSNNILINVAWRYIIGIVDPCILSYWTA